MLFRSLVTACLLLLLSAPAWAHFGMAIPSPSVADQQHKKIQTTFSFSHPFSGVGMDMERPARAGVLHDGRATDFTASLAPTTVMGHKAWRIDYAVKRPGAHILFMTPQPYWEPAEDASIIHYTKVVVPAYGVEEGWDAAVGFPIEIEPLTRPFGNYAGNVFTGRVLLNGKPLAGGEVEVEYYNQDKKLAEPTPFHETQLVKTDSGGVFSFACPQPGWWGFAALTTADYQLPDPDKKLKPVEIGGVLWIYMDAWMQK